MLMSLPHRRNYDIVIFGATSFTGKRLLHELINTLDASRGDENEDIKFNWAIAGRSFQKMEQLLLQVGRETKRELLGRVDMIQADVSNVSSILTMVQQSKVVLNCVGPYQKYGECVVKACAEYGTHHLDLAAEPLFLGQMELKYSRMAERSGAYIIGACGLFSIPSDCGALYLQHNFEGEVNSIESFLDGVFDSGVRPTFHSGTWKSAVWGAHYILNYIVMKGELNRSYFQPSSTHNLPFWPIQYRKEVKSWCLVAPFPDGEVMERTQRYLTQNENNIESRSFETQFYIQFPGLFSLAIFLVFTLTYLIIAQIEWGARLLEKYPKLFTFGTFSDKGPSAVAMNHTKFTLVAKGWSGDFSVQNDKRLQPNKTSILRVNGISPCYGGAVKMFLQAALTILREKENMPKHGGVYSPGIAFEKTNLIERLNRSGIQFRIEN